MRTLRGFAAIAAIVVMTAFAASAQTNLTTLDGASVNIQSQNGKVVVLAIGAGWLPLSEQQAGFANTLAKRYAGKNVVVYFVLTDSNRPGSKNYASNDDLRKFASDRKLSVTVLRDPDGAATLKKFRVEQVPSFVILNRSGALAGEPFGGIDPKYDITIAISKAIDGLL
ncbi:MAG: TlpA disulfide reductase family protein [Acidobacteriota bacterium]